MACDERFLSRQIAVSLGDSGVEMSDRFEVFVGERLVNERPEMFGGLKFRGARRLVERVLIPSGTGKFSGVCQPALSS